MRNQRKSQSRSRSRSRSSKRTRSRRVSKRSKEQVAYDAYMRKFNRYLEKLAQYEKKYGRVHGAQREPFGHHGSFEAPSSVSRSFLSPTAVSMEIVSPDVVTRSAANDGYGLPPSYEDVMLDSSFSASSPRFEDLSEPSESDVSIDDKWEALGDKMKQWKNRERLAVPSPSLSLLNESSFESPTSEIALDKLVAKAPVALLDDKGKEEAMEPPQKQMKVWDIRSEVLPTPTSEEKKEVEDILREVKAQDVPLSPAQESELADLLANAPVPAMQETFIPPSVMTDRMLEEPSQESQEELAKLLAGEGSPIASPGTVDIELVENLKSIPANKYVAMRNLLEALPESKDTVLGYAIGHFGVFLPDDINFLNQQYSEVRDKIIKSDDPKLIKTAISQFLARAVKERQAKDAYIDPEEYVKYFSDEQLKQFVETSENVGLSEALTDLGLYVVNPETIDANVQNLRTNILLDDSDLPLAELIRTILRILIITEKVKIDKVILGALARRNKHRRRSHHRRRRY